MTGGCKACLMTSVDPFVYVVVYLLSVVMQAIQMAACISYVNYKLRYQTPFGLCVNSLRAPITVQGFGCELTVINATRR